MRRTCAIALLTAVASPAYTQESDTHAERLLAARALTPERVLLLRGHLVNDALHEPVEIRFDAQGRLNATYDGTILTDIAFDGERAWSVDGAGRPYELGGMQRDLQLAIHGVLCGNWLAAQEWQLEHLAPPKNGRLHAQLVGRHVELQLEHDDKGLPRRVDLETFGRNKDPRFFDWQSNELGRWPARVEFRDGSRLAATFVYESLVQAEEETFGPPDDPGLDVHFDLDADPELRVRRIASGHMFVRAEIDGENVGWLAFDTGAGRTPLVAPVQFEGHAGRFVVDIGGGSPLYLNAPTVERLRLLERRNTNSTSVRGVGGLVTVRQGAMGEILFGDRSFDGLQATFTSSDVQGSWCDPYVDGVAGIALLRSGPVWFDYPGRRIGLAAGR